MLLNLCPMRLHTAWQAEQLCMTDLHGPDEANLQEPLLLNPWARSCTPLHQYKPFQRGWFMGAVGSGHS